MQEPLQPPVPSPEVPSEPTPPAAPSPLPADSRQQLPFLVVAVAIVAFALIVASIGYGIYKYLQANSKPPAPHVKIGLMEAFTGGSSAMGYGATKGIQLAKKQLGADNIEVVPMDSKCDPKTAADVVRRLIAQHVAAIIGEGCSSASLAALPAANNGKTVMISPSASSPALSIPDDYFFRVVPPDDYQGSFMAQTIYDRGIRTVGIFYTNEPYGTGISKVFKTKFEALGGKVVVSTPAEPDVIGLSGQISDLKAANPQAIFFAPNSVVSATAAIKLARSAGIKAPFFGGDLLYDKTLIGNTGDASEGLTVTSFPTGTKSFKQALQNEYQVVEQLYAAPQAYDAFKALYLAIQKGATTGEQIKDILPSISFDGVSAHIGFDQNGEIPGRDYKYELLQVKNGSFITVE